MLLLVLLALAFAPGLAGPFVLDDHVNLVPAWQWINGERGLADTLVGNASGPFGRPLAYATFLINAAATGISPWSYKLVNLMLHLAAAALALAVCRRVLQRAVPPAGEFAAFAIAAAWALHPMQVSTVLYVVQRMTILAAIAQLGVVLVYLHARAAPASSRTLLFGAIPLLVIAGVLGKETALLAPLLCLALEATLFATSPRPREFVIFHVLFVFVPAIAAAVFFALTPEWLAAGYAGREFTWTERVLSQPRVMSDYVASWVFPWRLSLYRDGYALSQSWLAPWTTIAAWLGGLLLIVAAWRWRMRRPMFALGVFWFLASHALESTIFALEPYFEHRNYLATLGLAFAGFDLLRSAWGARPASAARVATCVLLGVLALLTLQRSWQWGDLDRLLATQGPPAGETSRRLQVDRAIRAFGQGDEASRNAALDELDRGPAGNRAAAALWRATFTCETEKRLGPVELDALTSRPPAVLTHNHVSWLWTLLRRHADGRCPGIDRAGWLGLIEAWESSVRQPIAPYGQSQLAQMRALLQDESPP